MFDAPLDGLILWTGLALISLTVAGIAVSLPSATAPDAGAVARTIDEVATSPHRVGAAVHPDATSIRLRPTQVSLRARGGTSHATLVVADPVPAGNGSLREVLAGRAPADVYRTERSFERALIEARERMGTWRSAPDRLHVRRVSWREIDATLVG